MNNSKQHIKFLEWQKTILPLLLILFISSCINDEDSTPAAENEYITISPFIETGSIRYTGSEFEENDAIGLYVVPYREDNATPGSIVTDAYAVNAGHVYHESSWLLLSGGKLTWPSATRHVDLYSYFPFDSELNTLNPLQYPFTVNTDQRTKAGYELSDFLWSKTENIAPTSDPVEMIFSHALSKVKVNVNTEIDYLQTELADAIITILDVNPTGVISLADGTVSPSSTTPLNSIIAYKHATPSQGYQASAEGIIIPQEAQAGRQFIRIELPASGTRYHFTPSGNIPFFQGTERAINITITRLGLSVTVNDITEWQPTEIIEGEIGKPIPRVLDISNIDWQASRVHHVYDDEIWIADVCREYLNGGGVNSQAIVIYQVGPEGSLITSRGFVAQVMAYDAGTFTYYPSASNIHGGTVNWSTANSISSYSAGNSPIINKIEFRTDGTIVTVPETYITTLTTSPYQMEDVDGNHYATVKIANQYWTADNLRVQHYNDGTPLTTYDYEENPIYGAERGKLYTWNTMTGGNIAPQGWRTVSYDDFYALYEYVNPNSGAKMKANRLWSSLNYNNDITGFHALPAGYRNNTGTYLNLNNYVDYWTTTREGTNPRRIRLTYNSNAIATPQDLSPEYAFSIRLIRE